ncbi:hypothetical protein M3685_10720 [Heyndrickxia oleronia]|uniref:hypothetical protein n=1 Tax=Heyndrickxia TaxID=2837504 RepID=UPI00203AE109|nr:hypothetical protein [Heyndrickxia oleronia]MCM3454417.1 hypothetical protein [Heyndrickxia oleronia]
MRKWELSYPYIFALLMFIVVFYFKWDLKDVNNLPAILSSAVTISSIIIAFLATMISILISLGNSTVMKRINNNDSEGLLIGYNKTSIISGFLLAIYSMILNVFIGLDGLISNILLAALVALIVHFTLSSYRIVNLVSSILTQVLKENKTEDKKKKVFTPSISESE